MVTVASRMPFIEGIGDEVVIFTGLTVLIVCLVLAWFSTSVSEQPFIRAAVLVIERRQTQASVHTENAQTSETPNANSTATGEITNNKAASLLSSSRSTSIQSDEKADSQTTKSCERRDESSGENGSHEFRPDLQSSSFTLQPEIGEMENVSLGSSLSESKLYSQTARLPVKTTNSAPHVATTERSEDGDGPVDETNTEERTVELMSAEDISETINLSDPNLIKIRLKFLNDSQRLVNGKLEEPLGDFKRRYFHEELENDKIVRLIFNGQLLRSDQETLQFYGLHDNCVVHCQISNNVQSASATQNESYTELDLSRFMLPLFGVILGVIWYCRIQYRQFFNATSTFALLGITGLFLVSLVALFVPRRENRQSTWIS